MVEGLSKSRKGAESLLNKDLDVPSGKIESTFGNKGVLIVKLDVQKKYESNEKSSIQEGDFVSLKLYRKTKINKNKSY